MTDKVKTIQILQSPIQKAENSDLRGIKRINNYIKSSKLFILISNFWSSVTSFVSGIKRRRNKFRKKVSKKTQGYLI